MHEVGGGEITACIDGKTEIRWEANSGRMRNRKENYNW